MTPGSFQSLRLLACVGIGGLLFGPSSWAQESQAPLALPPVADVAAFEPAVDVSDLTQVARAQPAARARVMDTLNLGTTSVTGSQELPKVLYIVPWKESDLGDVVGRPVNTLLDEVLAPVDPEVFKRHLEYYDALYGDGDKE